MAQSFGARVLVDEAYLETLFITRHASLEVTTRVRGFLVRRNFSGHQQPDESLWPERIALWLDPGRTGVGAPHLAAERPSAATPAHPAERMSVMAFDHLAQFRARAQTLLTANRALLDIFLDSRADLDCFRPLAGSVVFPRLRHGSSANFLQTLAREIRDLSCARRILRSGSTFSPRDWRRNRESPHWPRATWSRID